MNRLKEIRERANKAVKSNWIRQDNFVYTLNEGGTNKWSANFQSTKSADRDEAIAVASFVVNAQIDIPYLLDLLDEMNKAGNMLLHYWETWTDPKCELSTESIVKNGDEAAKDLRTVLAKIGESE